MWFRRKIKCDGRQPCEFCSQAMTSCTFHSAYARGRAPLIPATSNVDCGRKSASTEEVIVLDKDPAAPRHHSMVGATEAMDHAAGLLEPLSSQMAPATSTYVRPPSLQSPGQSQTDLQGSYIGPSSGVSFLLRIQKRLEQAISFSDPSSIFTFGDAPLHLPDLDPCFCIMLPREEAQRLVDRYFDFAMPTYRFLHRPTIQKWLNEFYDTLGLMSNTQTAPAKIALIFMVIAHGRVYMPDDARPGPPDLR